MAQKGNKYRREKGEQLFAEHSMRQKGFIVRFNPFRKNPQTARSSFEVNNDI